MEKVWGRNRRHDIDVPQMLARVRSLSQGNVVVEVHIWDKDSDATEMVELGQVQARLNRLSDSEEVLGVIYYSGHDDAGREDFTTNQAGLEKFQQVFNTVADN